MMGSRATPDRFPALDGLRGLAVLAVVLFHAGALPFGYLGVDLFFALSGFLITGILLDAKASNASPREILVPFYARRALRIFPLALLVAAIVIAATRAGWEGAWYVSYIQNWFPHPGEPRALGHYWSLAVEEQFYVVWPFAVLALTSRKLGFLAVVYLMVGLLTRAWLMHAQPAWATGHILGDWTVVRADPIAAGALVSVLARTTGLERWRSTAVGAGLTAAGVAAIALYWQAMGTHTSRGYVVAQSAIAIAMGALVLWTLLASPRILGLRALRWLGTISYGLYIIHGAAGVWLRRVTTQPVALSALSLGVCVPLAAVSWYGFERPLLSLKRHFPMPRAQRSSRMSLAPEIAPA